MKLIEVTRSSAERGDPRLHASYTIKPSDNVGVLRITKRGIAFMKDNDIKIDVDQKYKVFIDQESFILAFKKDPEGKFKFTLNIDETYRISYKDVFKMIKQNVRYTIRPMKDYDLLLIPLEMAEKDENTEKSSEKKNSKK